MLHMLTSIILACYGADFERVYCLEQLCNRGCHVIINIAFYYVIGFIDCSR
nr:MAG TPA: hypothetical protein [Caudoviricetes sp.]